MTNRSYTYARLTNQDSIPVSRRDSSTDEDADHLSNTKLRRLNTSHNKRDNRWPGSASHLNSFSPPEAQKEFIEHVIKPKETLQGLAVLYRCSVFELKLANNIQKESEFFARRTLKIPVLQHSSLTERVIPSESQSEETVTAQNGIADSSNQTLQNSTEFLKQVDQDLDRLKEKARVYDIDSLDSTPPLDLDRHRRTVRLNRPDCQGDDCGLSWTHILGLALLVLLACPLLYFLYLELNLHKSTTMDSIHNTTTILP